MVYKTVKDITYVEHNAHMVARAYEVIRIISMEVYESSQTTILYTHVSSKSERNAKTLKHAFIWT